MLVTNDSIMKILKSVGTRTGARYNSWSKCAILPPEDLNMCKGFIQDFSWEGEMSMHATGFCR